MQPQHTTIEVETLAKLAVGMYGLWILVQAGTVAGCVAWVWIHLNAALDSLHLFGGF